MAIAAAMSLEDDPLSNDNGGSGSGGGGGGEPDEHENDMVMPGFRFHPTEEELVEFYLRRKVEGKRFNVELITFLDLYHYDPWELPALAAIGEKEWFFYVPRDKKYRNGDRPNRVTTSGYWKATGADRMIRGENNRSIGLKKTLVFYSGKAPKGVRTSWIMNEYRLPHHDTERYQKAEISLCRVYKRPGVEDHNPSLPRCLPTTRTTSSRTISEAATASSSDHRKKQMMSMSDADTSSSSDVTTTLGLSKHSIAYGTISPVAAGLLPPPAMEDEQVRNTVPVMMSSLHHSKSASDFFPSTSSSSSNVAAAAVVDDLHLLVNLQHLQPQPQPPHEQNQLYYVPHQHSNPHPQPQAQPFPFPTMLLPQQVAAASQPQHNQLGRFLSPPQTPATPATFSDRLWEWNPIPNDANTGEHNPPFKYRP
ncbi:hypothetical protein MLD38_022849 [Melastoma candidum]|uniref:Uncharacterized protein n=1 Tax=Melastoma candidum TaxID=119954 RepID=A0ACB9QLT6_9MYRT|nr:hypothetical protein MLD38_022849 [Melastoma candidum]